MFQDKTFSGFVLSEVCANLLFVTALLYFFLLQHSHVRPGSYNVLEAGIAS